MLLKMPYALVPKQVQRDKVVEAVTEGMNRWDRRLSRMGIMFLLPDSASSTDYIIQPALSF